MATLTQNALAEIELEKNFTPEEIADFLRTPNHFLSVSNGLKRELQRLGYDGNDETLLKSFKKLLKSAGYTTGELRNANAWLIDNVLPSRKNSIRLCFAFKLSGQNALDFLWKTCRVNGFNFRKPEDVVYFYCLENGKSFSGATEIIKLYAKATFDQTYSVGDYTKRTQTLKSVFYNALELSENDFIDKLCLNKKNFIDYSVSAFECTKKIASRIEAFIRADIAEYNHFIESSGLKGYDCTNISLYNEIIYTLSIICKASDNTKTPFNDIMDRFPRNEYILKMLSKPSEATDKEHDKARKVFVLLFFADYALDPPPDDFFYDFVIALNDTLDRCGYARLYPANPFDWLILRCIRSLNYIDQFEGDNPLELFNEILMLLAEEETA